MITSKTKWTSTFVDITAATTIDTRDNTFTKLTPVTIVTSATVTGILLYTFSSILTLVLADSSFTVATLEARRAGAAAWHGARATIHTLGVAEGSVAVLPHITFTTQAPLTFVTNSSILTLLITLRIRAYKLSTILA